MRTISMKKDHIMLGYDKIHNYTEPKSENSCLIVIMSLNNEDVSHEPWDHA